MQIGGAVDRALRRAHLSSVKVVRLISGGKEDTGYHWSSCAVHNGPALPVGPCDCGRSAPAPSGGDGGSWF